MALIIGSVIIGKVEGGIINFGNLTCITNKTGNKNTEEGQEEANSSSLSMATFESASLSTSSNNSSASSSADN